MLRGISLFGAGPGQPFLPFTTCPLSLLSQRPTRFHIARYTHLLRLIESTRDFEDQQQLDTADGIKATLLSNLALVAFQQEEYARSIEWCDKALNMDPENAKVRRCTVLSSK
jgi:tetratricopeptide (TPR) repeat protein